ncbi:MAG: folate family ECF transporter S component, partial [Clostridium sp.]|nr:folate family ECF transporter S component [Clostridium sp.]
GIMAAAADILGSVLFSSSGTYFPGFTLSAFVGGIIYGLFLYNKKINMLNIFLAVVLINVFVNMGLNTIWLTMLTGKGFMAIIIPRLIKNIIMIPIQTVLVYICCDRIVSLVKLKFVKQV